MKKHFMLLILAVTVGLTSVHAQISDGNNQTTKSEFTGKRFRVNLGLEAALPMGDLKSEYSVGGGLTLRFLYNINQTVGVTFTTGAVAFAPKDLGNLGQNAKALLNIPFKVGGRFMFTPNLYGMGELGITSSMNYFTDTNGNIQHTTASCFTWAPSLGVVLGGFDASLRYESYSKDAFKGDFLALRLSFNF
ncbi:hypothetical protein [Paracoccus sp. (in: a-proteobacteria)]|uniref:hypothetical protein n=1 Tax=Paracoccus sp. TaxID=267 RepID=UPI002B0038C6|nr:hypothetical protein [Paracoccus sp. (in: a-proteobacteria)]